MSYWNIFQEQQFIRDVVAAFHGSDDWSSHVRERHGSVNEFLRRYVNTLKVRVRSFDSDTDGKLMLESDRDSMREFCTRMMVKGLHPVNGNGGIQ